MKDKDFGGLILIAFVAAVLIFLGLLLKEVSIASNEQAEVKDYIAETYGETAGTYPNAMTDKRTDFFVATKDSGILYVDVIREDDNLRHIEKPVEGNASLEAMSQGSLDQIAAYQARPKTAPTTTVFFPM